METRKLEHLVELAATGSFSQAAANLHLTQSALSKSIQSLEAELGIQLIERLGRRCIATPAGASVIARAIKLLLEIDNLTQSIQDASEVSGTLKVGFGAGPGAGISADLIAHVLEQHPRLRLLVRRGTAKFLLEALRDRSIDTVVIDSRSFSPQDDLVVEHIGELEPGVILRAGHPLASHPNATMEDILKYPILNTAVSDEVARMVQSHYGLRQDIRLDTVVESEELEPLLDAVARSNGIFLGVTAAARSHIAAGILQTIRIENQMQLTIPVCMIRLASRGDSRLIAVARDFIAAWFRPAVAPSTQAGH